MCVPCSLWSAGIRAGRHTTSFCASLLHLFADGEVKKDAPSQVGKSKSTENGEQSQNDPLFLAQLYVQEGTTDTSQEVVFVKR
jgi:hypothetical protein